ncbi:MAG: AbrB/MazE/SpoVT family DNA-binding domain-containing protein [Clostridiales bacterium]|jgi:transcriptional pleiotropic regulator of transition state genes|nr:AbrB/MazE/SpoVT family DNA-binding domain-containing protein [Clostridiales bacterium]
MKSTGIVRRIDDAGRIVVPMELRRNMNIKDSEDFLEIFVDDDKIILKKYMPSCIFCKSLDDVVEHQGIKVCKDCIANLNSKIADK